MWTMVLWRRLPVRELCLGRVEMLDGINVSGLPLCESAKGARPMAWSALEGTLSSDTPCRSAMIQWTSCTSCRALLRDRHMSRMAHFDSSGGKLLPVCMRLFVTIRILRTGNTLGL